MPAAGTHAAKSLGVSVQVQLPPGLGTALPVRAPQRSHGPSGAFAQLLDESKAPAPSTSSSPSAASASGREVAARRTPLSAEQAKTALTEAWTQRFGQPPSEATVGILTAQWAHETAGGDRMFNYNFGGVKGTGPSGLTVAYRTREGSGATQTFGVDNFRAYETAAEGASDYLGLLERRYGGALEQAKLGDPHAFVRELKVKGYFTGDEGLYAKSITRLAEQAVGPGILNIGAGGPLPTREELLRAGAPGTGLQNVAFPDLLNTAQVDAIIDEMSRTALRLASSAGSRDEQRPRLGGFGA